MVKNFKFTASKVKLTDEKWILLLWVQGEITLPPLISDKTNKSVISSGKLNQGKTLKSKNGFTVPKF